MNTRVEKVQAVEVSQYFPGMDLVKTYPLICSDIDAGREILLSIDIIKAYTTHAVREFIDQVAIAIEVYSKRAVSAGVIKQTIYGFMASKKLDINNIDKISELRFCLGNSEMKTKVRIFN